MNCKKTLLASLFLSGAALASLYAFSPTLLTGTSVEQRSYSEADSALWYHAYGGGSWRTTLSANTYLSVNGNARLSYLDQNGGSFSDNESVEADFGWLADKGSTVLEIGLRSSIDDINDGTVLNPEWSAEQTLSLGGAKPELYWRYSGEYLYQQQGSDDKTAHETALGLMYDPTVMRGYRLEVTGSGTFWSEQYLFDSGGGETETLRRDYRLALEAEVNGLAGYFADWAIILLGGALFSNGNYYLSDLSTLQSDSYDAWFNGFEAEWSWSPSRSLQLSSSMYAESRYYLHRKALSGDGGLSDNLLSTVNTGAQVEADWTPDDRVYFILSMFGGRTFSNDPNFESWNMGISGSVEYGF